jgi:hypothetical protein
MWDIIPDSPLTRSRAEIEHEVKNCHKAALEKDLVHLKAVEFL